MVGLSTAEDVVDNVVDGGATHVYVVAPAAVKVTALPGQTEAFDAPAEIDKKLPTTTEDVAEAVQVPFAPITT